MNIGNIIEDIFYPPVCLLCGKYFALGTRPLICDNCLEKYGAFKKKCCRCNTPLSTFNNFPYCSTCHSAGHRFDGVISAFYYEDTVRSSIIQHKFDFNYNHSLTLSHHLSEIIKELYPDTLPDYIIPVPTSKKRLKLRGYNPLMEIGIRVSNSTNIPLLSDVILKIKDTPQQSVASSRISRFRNVKGSFAVTNKDILKNKNIILLDDVYTTGATTYECSKILKRAGVSHILVATVAISDYFRR